MADGVPDSAASAAPPVASLPARRIVFIVSFWSAGGAPGAAARIGSALQRRGHVVEIWYLYRRGNVPLAEGPCHILVDKDLSGSLGYLALPWIVLRRVRRFRPDTIFSFTPMAHLLGQVAGALGGVRNRIVAHRVVCNQYHPLLRWLDMLLGSVGLYTRVAAVSEAVRRSVAHYPRSYGRLVEVVYNGVDRVPSGIGREAARAAFGLPPGASLVLAVGRLAPQKNYPLLVDAVAPLVHTHLVVAGEGPLRHEIERQAAVLGVSHRVHLLGHLSPAALSDLFRACDVFALASIFEGQSNALLEAMAEGIPILASDIPEQAETLRSADGREAGVLLPVGDAAPWTEAIRRVTGDPALRQALGAAARERAGHFTVDRMIDGFERLVRG